MKRFDINEFTSNNDTPVCLFTGEDVRILSARCKGPYPIIAIYKADTDAEVVIQVNEQGECINDINDEYSKFTLYFKPIRHEGWINIYEKNDGNNICSCVFATEPLARNNINITMKYQSTIHIEWEED